MDDQDGQGASNDGVASVSGNKFLAGAGCTAVSLVLLVVRLALRTASCGQSNYDFPTTSYYGDLPYVTDVAAGTVSPPIEFTATIDGIAHDVTEDPIALADGTSIALIPQPMRTFIGDEFSFSYADLLEFSDHDNGSVSLNQESSYLVISSVDRSIRERRALESVFGDDSTPLEPSTRMMFGRTVTGRRQRGPDHVHEVYLVPRPGERSVMIEFRQMGSFEPEALVNVMTDLSFAPRDPSPPFRAVAGLQEVPVFFDQPTTIGGPNGDHSLVLTQRSLIKRVLGGIALEYAPSVTATITDNPLGPAILLITANGGVVQVLISPIAVAPEAVAAATPEQMSGAVARTRILGGESLTGITFRSIEYGDILQEIYSVRRGEYHPVVVLSYDTATEAESVALADSVVGSMRPAATL